MPGGKVPAAVHGSKVSTRVAGGGAVAAMVVAGTVTGALVAGAVMVAEPVPAAGVRAVVHPDARSVTARAVTPAAASVTRPWWSCPRRSGRGCRRSRLRRPRTRRRRPRPAFRTSCGDARSPPLACSLSRSADEGTVVRPTTSATKVIARAERAGSAHHRAGGSHPEQRAGLCGLPPEPHRAAVHRPVALECPRPGRSLHGTRGTRAGRRRAAYLLPPVSPSRRAVTSDPRP
jgi:hypothetical protein